MSRQPRHPAGSPGGTGGQFAAGQHAEADIPLGNIGPGLPDYLLKLLLPGTAETWAVLAPLLPASAYLAGGTALAVHLRHRTSRDLDFMLGQHEDLTDLRDRISARGKFAVSLQDDQTLNGLFNDTKVQFLEVSDQQMVGPVTKVAGINVASVEDIAAMKLNAVLGLAELRDYFDLMELDRRRVVPVEHGIAMFLERYRQRDAKQNVLMIVQSLGYLDDVADDPALPSPRSDIVQFWQNRQPQLMDIIGRW